MMTLIFFMGMLLVVALAVYAIDRSPLSPNFRWVAVVLVCLIAAVVVLQRMGVVGG